MAGHESSQCHNEVRLRGGGRGGAGRRAGVAEWEPNDLRDLEKAVYLLENPGLVARISDAVGTPIEYVLDRLPKGAGAKISKTVHA